MRIKTQHYPCCFFFFFLLNSHTLWYFIFNGVWYSFYNCLFAILCLYMQWDNWNILFASVGTKPKTSKLLLLRKMVADLRTDSSDYRTELLSPPPPGQKSPVPCDQPSWRLNIDGFNVPERHMDSHFGFLYLIKSLSKFFLL